METTSDNNGKAPEPAPPAFPRWVWLAGAGGMLAIGWLFILITNSFHLTAPVVFVCLGYFAGIAAVYTLFRTGASAVTGAEDDDDPASWGRPVGARGELEREKRVLLKAIKEAEFDLQMGKLSKADAEAMIASYRAQAIAVIKEIDRKEGAEATAREEIEREVRARLEVMKAKKGGEAAEKRPAGKKADKGKRGGAPAKKGEAAKQDEAPEAAKAEPKRDERILDVAAEAEPPAGEAPEAKAADAADESAGDAAEPKADAAARAAVANDASGAPASAKEATP